jgi:hypothetical protein
MGWLQWALSLSPVLAAIAGWLGRHTLSTWLQSIRAFVACEGRCLTLSGELADARESSRIARAERDQARETATYLNQLLKDLMDSARLVKTAQDEGLLTVSEPSPTKPPSSPRPSDSLPATPGLGTTATPSTPRRTPETDDE